MLKVSGCCTPPSHLSRPGAIEIGIHILIRDSEVPRFEPVFDNEGQNDEISYFVGWNPSNSLVFQNVMHHDSALIPRDCICDSTSEAWQPNQEQYNSRIFSSSCSIVRSLTRQPTLQSQESDLQRPLTPIDGNVAADKWTNKSLLVEARWWQCQNWTFGSASHIEDLEIISALPIVSDHGTWSCHVGPFLALVFRTKNNLTHQGT